MQHKNAASFLAFTLAAAVPLFADSLPGHSRSGSKYVTFSEGFTSEQSSQGGAAECNFLIGALKENGLSASSLAMGQKGSGLGSGGASTGNSVHLVDFGGNNGGTADKDKGKGKGKGQQGGVSGGENGTATGNGGSAPLVSVPEPSSQTLLLVGLSGLGVAFSRRRTLTIAT